MGLLVHCRARGKGGDLVNRMKIGEIFSSPVEADVELQLTLNVLGFDVAEQYQNVLEHHVLPVAFEFALAWLKTQADEAASGIYDGRNAASSHIALKLDSVCDLRRLRMQQFGEDRVNHYINDVVNALSNMHRTLKQTLSKFCFFVLEQEAGRVASIRRAIDALCAEPLVYYREPCKRPEYRVETWLNTADWFRSVPYI